MEKELRFARRLGWAALALQSCLCGFHFAKRDYLLAIVFLLLAGLMVWNLIQIKATIKRYREYKSQQKALFGDKSADSSEGGIDIM